MCRGCGPHLFLYRWPWGLNRCPGAEAHPCAGTLHRSHPTGAISLPSPPLSVAFNPQFPGAQDPRHCSDVSAGEQTLVHRIAQVNMLRPLAPGTRHRRLPSTSPGWQQGGNNPHLHHELPLCSTNPQPGFRGLHVAARHTALSHLCMQPPRVLHPASSLSVRLCHSRDRPLCPSRQRQAVAEGPSASQWPRGTGVGAVKPRGVLALEKPLLELQ